MTENGILGQAEIESQAYPRESLTQFCARLSEKVFLEQLSTWSMLKAAHRCYPEIPENEIDSAASLAIEDRRKESRWKS